MPAWGSPSRAPGKTDRACLPGPVCHPSRRRPDTVPSFLEKGFYLFVLRIRIPGSIDEAVAVLDCGHQSLVIEVQSTVGCVYESKRLRIHGTNTGIRRGVALAQFFVGSGVSVITRGAMFR